SFFRFWTRQAEARPFVTIAATEACLSACGDLIAQTIGKHLPSNRHEKETDKEEHSKGYDLHRTLRFVFFSMCVSPIGVRWHRFLDRRFPIRSQTACIAAAQVGKRLLCDLLFYEPTMYALFFSSMAFLEGGSLSDAKFRLSTLLLPTYLTGLTISPIIQTVNFAFVPLIYRVPFSSCFDLFWDSYLSWVN
ncbi:hypothetical protein COEREDRAFT_31792, partial [Coemansia reversa NRRL 1564]